MNHTVEQWKLKWVGMKVSTYTELYDFRSSVPLGISLNEAIIVLYPLISFHEDDTIIKTFKNMWYGKVTSFNEIEKLDFDFLEELEKL